RASGGPGRPERGPEPPGAEGPLARRSADALRRGAVRCGPPAPCGGGVAAGGLRASGVASGSPPPCRCPSLPLASTAHPQARQAEEALRARSTSSSPRGQLPGRWEVPAWRARRTVHLLRMGRSSARSSAAAGALLAAVGTERCPSEVARGGGDCPGRSWLVR
ncbi:unnamed protein product, partial [Prorocentrum cordatum]